MTLLHIQADTDSQDFTLDQESYGKMIDYMNTLTPFEAVRYAAEINKMNGFEVVSRVEIAEWKKAVRENEKIKTQKSILGKSKVGILAIEKSNIFTGQKPTSEIKNEKSNIKNGKSLSEYQKAYMTMLSM